MRQPRNALELDEGYLQQRWPIMRGLHADNDIDGIPATHA